jgi:hypothetical protein
MTRQQLSDLWPRRGDAWDSLQRAERALLEAQLVATDETLSVRLRDALGCIHGATELLALATERIHALVEQVDSGKLP